MGRRILGRLRVLLLALGSADTALGRPQAGKVSSCPGAEAEPPRLEPVLPCRGRFTVG